MTLVTRGLGPGVLVVSWGLGPTTAAAVVEIILGAGRAGMAAVLPYSRALVALGRATLGRAGLGPGSGAAGDLGPSGADKGGYVSQEAAGRGNVGSATDGDGFVGGD